MDYIEDVNNCAKHKELTVLTNGVSIIFDRKWHLTFLPLNVHVNKDYIETILSFKYITNIPGVRGTMDTSTEKDVNMILRDGTVFKFKSC